MDFPSSSIPIDVNGSWALKSPCTTSQILPQNVLQIDSQEAALPLGHCPAVREMLSTAKSPKIWGWTPIFLSLQCTLRGAVGGQRVGMLALLLGVWHPCPSSEHCAPLFQMPTWTSSTSAPLLWVRSYCSITINSWVCRQLLDLGTLRTWLTCRTGSKFSPLKL